MTKQEIIELFDKAHESYHDIAVRITDLYENLAFKTFNQIEDELDYLNHAFFEFDEEYKEAYRELHDALFSAEVDEHGTYFATMAVD